MRVIGGLAGLRVPQPLCLAMGVFDGVHVGHQAIIAAAVKLAGRRGAPAVLTFDPHPDAVLSREGAPQLLTTAGEKLDLLRRVGVKVVVVVEFTRSFASIPPVDFIERLLADQLKACCVVVGEGWRFGAEGAGSPELLKKMARGLGFRVKVVPAVKVGGVIASSTRIRRLLQQGRVASARGFLGRDYHLSGEVVSGDGRGRQLGFPTANVSPPAEKLIPAEGVYACYAGLRALRPAVTSIGVRPTFGPAGPRRIEVHLLESPRPPRLLGRRLRVAFVERLRGERRFASPGALTAQMRCDCDRARWLLSALHPSPGML